MLAFVLPTKNEANTIGNLISELKSICSLHGWPAQFLVVDDSSDNTASIAKKAGAEIIVSDGSGLGHAMKLGLTWAYSVDCDWVVTIDTDGQADLNDVKTAVMYCLNGHVDMVVTSRFLKPDSFEYDYPFLNWIGNRLLVFILRLATFKHFTDSHGGIRVIKKSVIGKLKIYGKHTYVQETLISAHRAGLEIAEIPGRWKKRKSGESRVVASILRYIIRTLPILLYHLRVHYFLLSLSLLSFIYLLYMRAQIDAFYVLPFVIIFLLGLYINTLPVFLDNKADEQ